MKLMVGAYKSLPIKVKHQISRTIKIEGGYVNDPDDSGGETNFGITKAVAEEFQESWNDYLWTGLMQTMPVEFAQDVYTYKYYLKPRIDMIAECSEILAEEVFDAGVNSGTMLPIEWLQKTLNVLNNREKYYKDIYVDGIMGSGTQAALQTYLGYRGEEGERVLYNAINCLQGAFYINLAHRREKDEKFVYGWLSHRLDFK